MKKALSTVLLFALLAALWVPNASALTTEEDLSHPVLPDGIPEEFMPTPPAEPE